MQLAYATVGDGPPLVKAANWLTHLDYDWESLVWRHWWRELSARHRLVRYDERGCGLSDWDVDDFSLDSVGRPIWRRWSTPPASTGSPCWASPGRTRSPSTYAAPTPRTGERA